MQGMHICGVVTILALAAWGGSACGADRIDDARLSERCRDARLRPLGNAKKITRTTGEEETTGRTASAATFMHSSTRTGHWEDQVNRMEELR